jgi:hypothetical protein
MNTDELIKNADLQTIASEGSVIYQEIKDQYEPREIGKFLAIDIESKDVYLGTTSAEAVEQARESHPQKVFYVVKIGFEAAETMAHLFSSSQN